MNTNATPTVDKAGIAARIKLAQLNMGRFSPIRKHRAETIAENQRHNVHDVARVSVKLTDNATLKAIINTQQALRTEHNRLTLPSDNEGSGMRLLPAGREFEHAETLRKLSDEHNRLVGEFMSEYDEIKEQARIRMNGLFDETHWPPHEIAEAKFYVRTRYLPMPTDGAWGQWLDESIQIAEAELQDRLRKILQHVAERCRAEKLHSSVFDHLREIAALVPDLDFAGHFTPVIEAMKPLTTIHAKDIRDSEVMRDVVARRADSISAMLGGIK